MEEKHRKQLIQELIWQLDGQSAAKDIIIVAHNQVIYLKETIESIQLNTKNYRLLIWDNSSNEATKEYLSTVNYDVLITNKENIGYVQPNNVMANFCLNPYVILLNSDTKVRKGWDEALIGFLRNNQEYKIVGYQGGILDDNNVGIQAAWGENIDYVMGWCMCFPLDLYREIKLFDENIKFAYGEDSDFCLRAKHKGYKIFALHLEYVDHIGAATSKLLDLKDIVAQNHQYLKTKWSKNERNQVYLLRQG